MSNLVYLKKVAKLNIVGSTTSQLLTGSNPDSKILNNPNLESADAENLLKIPTNQSAKNIRLINLLAETELGLNSIVLVQKFLAIP